MVSFERPSAMGTDGFAWKGQSNCSDGPSQQHRSSILAHRRQFGGNTSLNEEALMAETELQIAAREASDQKQAVLRQQSVVLGLKGEGGERLAKATELLESMQEELHIREARLERLVLNA
jgi:hypothetical protein